MRDFLSAGMRLCEVGWPMGNVGPALYAGRIPASSQFCWQLLGYEGESEELQGGYV